METRGKIKHNGPKYVKYASPAARMRTFTAWPPALKQQKQKMVEAGFFYTGKSDMVICFYCSTILRDWMENDDPWEQHAGWSKDCVYVSLHKTESYIIKSYFKVRNHNTLNNPPQTESMDIFERDIDTTMDIVERDVERDMDTTKVCRVCMDAEVEVVYLPCAHAVTCKRCAPCFDNCIICRNPVKEIIKLYFS